MKTVKAKTFNFGQNLRRAYTKRLLRNGNIVISHTLSRLLRSYVCFADWRNFNLQQKKRSKYASINGIKTNKCI